MPVSKEWKLFGVNMPVSKHVKPTYFSWPRVKSRWNKCIKLLEVLPIFTYVLENCTSAAAVLQSRKSLCWNWQKQVNVSKLHTHIIYIYICQAKITYMFKIKTWLYSPLNILKTQRRCVWIIHSLYSFECNRRKSSLWLLFIVVFT